MGDERAGPRKDAEVAREPLREGPEHTVQTGAATEVGAPKPPAGERRAEHGAPTEQAPAGHAPTEQSLAIHAPTEPGESKGELAQRIERALEADSPSFRHDDFIGRTVANRYVIESKIGSGGMGAVYKASQLGMDRHVAIKVLLAEFAKNPMIIKRFHMEALAVSKLEHPNTIRIFDFGQTEDGVLFISMEFLQGRSLEHELRAGGAMPAKRALRIMAQVCGCLAEAHDKGIVHRDLKPDNVFLTRVDDDDDFVKVLDFGVAKLKADERRHGTLTQAGMVFGTPKYMSPEQSRSDVTDPRSDIYALGVILYEMLTGKPPFDAENALSILIKHVQEPVKPFAVVRPDIVIPPKAEAIVLRCLEKKAEDRFQSAREMVAAITEALPRISDEFAEVVTREAAQALGMSLERSEAFTAPARSDELLPGQSAETAPMSPEEAARLLAVARRRRRRRVALLAAGGLAALLGLGVLVGYLSLPRAPEGFQHIFAEPPGRALADVPAAAPDIVRVQLRSEPPGATVKLDGRVVAQAPFELERVRADRTDGFTFELDGFQSVRLPVSYRESATFRARLEPVVPEVIVKEVTRTVTKEVPVLVAPTRPRTRTQAQPEEPKKPVRFRGGKLGDLKKLGD